ncbi:MAG: hypothetical protein GY820_23710 [Gammaproteobacteria bacterium]|nr:hypothetical protein [Gammaproteobacteria bacterium]
MGDSSGDEDEDKDEDDEELPFPYRYKLAPPLHDFLMGGTAFLAFPLLECLC